jgi:hypothetical protein
MIENISYDKGIVAIIIYNDYDNDGIKFLSPTDFPLQLGYMHRPNGYKVMPHIHNSVHRECIGTQEVLFIKKGVIQIDFYSFDQDYLESRVLKDGDIILLAGAGHGIVVIEEAVIVEVKNGPYIEEADKGRFEGNKEEKIKSHDPR